MIKARMNCWTGIWLLFFVSPLSYYSWHSSRRSYPWPVTSF